MSTAKEGSVGFKDAAGVLSKHTIIAAPVVTCITMSGIWTISATQIMGTDLSLMFFKTVVSFLMLGHVLDLLQPPYMDSCIFRQLWMEACSENIALSHSNNISSFVL